MKKTIAVVELFAGVGGFHLGLSSASTQFNVIWANQWEPGRKSQHAFDCYFKHFSDSCVCSNEDIAVVKKTVPIHDLLVGGFPCQDYSVAATNAKGIEGKKGVLWWTIRDIIKDRKPPYVLLENVDRLLKSPAKQRGRDFAIILRCFHNLDYCVQWRVINAADYGHPQKRRRVFIFACRKTSALFRKYSSLVVNDILMKEGIFAKAFPVKDVNMESSVVTSVDISKKSYKNLAEVSSNFKFNFENAGFMMNGLASTKKVEPQFEDAMIFLEDILEKNVADNFYLNDNIEKWTYLKGSKKELRTKPNGENYYYTEGPVPFPDKLNSPARTILTSESSVNRSSHVVLDPVSNRLRILTPEECEKLNEFPLGWTDTGMPQKFRYFVMGNALVVGLIKSIGIVIHEELENIN